MTDCPVELPPLATRLGHTGVELSELDRKNFRVASLHPGLLLSSASEKCVGYQSVDTRKAHLQYACLPTLPQHAEETSRLCPLGSSTSPFLRPFH